MSESLSAEVQAAIRADIALAARLGVMRSPNDYAEVACGAALSGGAAPAGEDVALYCDGCGCDSRGSRTEATCPHCGRAGTLRRIPEELSERAAPPAGQGDRP